MQLPFVHISRERMETREMILKNREIVVYELFNGWPQMSGYHVFTVLIDAIFSKRILKAHTCLQIHNSHQGIFSKINSNIKLALHNA